MIKSRLNVFLIGIGVAYVGLFLGQLFSTNLFSVRLYNTIAWVSLDLSFVELLKSCLLKFNESLLNQKLYLQTLYDIINQRCAESFFVSSNNENIRQEIQSTIDEVETKSKKYNVTIKIGKTSVFLGHISAMVMLIITPFIDIPDNLKTQKIISLLTLLTFALLFISISLDELFSTQQTEYREKFKYVVEIESLRNENLRLKNGKCAPFLTPTENDGE